VQNLSVKLRSLNPCAQDHDRSEPSRDPVSLVGCKIEVVGDKTLCIKGFTLMGSLELIAKTKEELSEWRLAFEQATTPITSTFEEHVIETKKIYAQMSDVIQKHIHEDLQDTRHNAENIEDCRFGTALHVSLPHFISYMAFYNSLPTLFLMRVQISIRSVQDFCPFTDEKNCRRTSIFLLK
jgi:hypothetical protein